MICRKCLKDYIDCRCYCPYCGEENPYYNQPPAYICSQQQTPTWDPQAFCHSFAKATLTENESDKSHLFQEVFHSTIEIVKRGEYSFSFFEGIDKYVNDELGLEGKYVFLNKHLYPYSKGTLYSSFIGIRQPNHLYSTKIGVVDNDCVSEAISFYKSHYLENRRIALLSCASAKNPGGSVTRGKCGQEEYLVLVSDYYRHLFIYSPDTKYSRQFGLFQADTLYPLNSDYGGVYSPNVVFFRGTQNEGFALLPRVYKFDIIAVPSVNYRDYDALEDCNEKYSIIRNRLINKIKTIFNIAIENEVDTLVLTAWGCGAFACPAELVAKLFHDLLLSDYYGYFKDIIFAIDKSRSPYNYQSFVDIFGSFV